MRELDFRAMLPVNVGSRSERESFGNRVAMLVVRLPLDESDPAPRLERVVRTRTELRARTFVTTRF